MAHLSTEGLRAQSISGYLSLVQHLSIEAGLSPLAREGCPRLAYVLKGVSRSQAASGRPRRLPITPRILLSLKAVWESGSLDSYSARLLWAMSLSAFFGCFRIGELTMQDASFPAAAEVADVSFEGHRSGLGSTFASPRLTQVDRALMSSWALPGVPSAPSQLSGTT